MLESVWAALGMLLAFQQMSKKAVPLFCFSRFIRCARVLCTRVLHVWPAVNLGCKQLPAHWVVFLVAPSHPLSLLDF